MIDPKDFLTDGNDVGISLPDLESLQKAKILRFVPSKKGEPMSKDCGKVIFVDHPYREMVKVGETWICRIRPATRDYDFAIPIQRIDGEFIMGMKPELLEDLGKIMISEHQDEVRELAIPMIRPQLEDQILKRDVSMERNQDLDKDDEEGKPIRSGDIFSILNESMEDDCSTHPVFRGIDIIGVLFGHDILDDYVAVAVSPDTLMSRMFDSPRYSVHVSLDHKKIVVASDPDGDVRCVNHKLRIWGLESIMEFKPDEVLTILPSKVDESMMIRIP